MINAKTFSSFSSEMQKQSILGTLLTMPIRRSLGRDALAKGLDTKRLKQLRDAIVEGDKTEIKIISDRAAIGPHYDSSTNSDGSLRQWVKVRKDEDPAILAHELGHSELDRETLGRILQSKPMRLATVLGAAIGGRLATSHGGATIGAAIAATSALPILAYEGMASSRAIDRLRRAGATEQEVGDAKKRLLKAWGTYATIPVAAAGDALTFAGMAKALRGVLSPASVPG